MIPTPRGTSEPFYTFDEPRNGGTALLLVLSVPIP
jgi:hypothetical protein